MAYKLGDTSYAQGNHSADMLMGYLPKEKILVNDLLHHRRQAPPPPLQRPACATSSRTSRS